METVNCGLCQNSEVSLVYNLTDLLLDRRQIKTKLVECQDCGLVYQNPRPTLEEMGVHYPPEYEPYGIEDSSRSKSWLLNKALWYGIRKRCRSVIFYKQAGRLLDVGCSTGTFLRGMRELPGWELHGVEINPNASWIAREKYGLNVVTGTLEEASYPESYFDAITLWDVLEHLHNPTSSLREIHRILKPGGILVIRVPNRDSWEAKLFGPYWAGLDAPRHLFLFDKRTLRAMLEKTSFKVFGMSCRSGAYPTFVLSVRFWLTARTANRPLREAIFRTLNLPMMKLLSSPFFFPSTLGLRGSLLTVTSFKA